MNKALLIGHLGKDPEISHTQRGTKVARFSLATNKSYKDQETGERKKITDWHNIVVFNEQLADVAEKYLKKGAKVWIEGEIKTRTYEKDGEKRYMTEIVLGSGFPWPQITMLDRKEGGAPPAESEADYGSSPATSVREDLDDGIPF